MAHHQPTLNQCIYATSYTLRYRPQHRHIHHHIRQRHSYDMPWYGWWQHMQVLGYPGMSESPHSGSICRGSAISCPPPNQTLRYIISPPGTVHALPAAGRRALLCQQRQVQHLCCLLLLKSLCPGCLAPPSAPLCHSPDHPPSPSPGTGSGWGEGGS
jgi:hypothetical protein